MTKKLKTTVAVINDKIVSVIDKQKEFSCFLLGNNEKIPLLS